MRSITWFITGMVALTAAQSTHAARPLGPPIEELLSAPDRIRIAAAMALKSDVPDRVKFGVSEELSGDSPRELILRADESTLAAVVPGERYIVAWTDLRKVRLLREGYETDPEGPSIVLVRGMTTRALYRDSPELRRLFSMLKDRSSVEVSEEIDALLAQIPRDDEFGRDLAVAQLLLDPGLGGQFNEAQARLLRGILDSGSLSAQQRDYLLQVAMRMPEDLTTGWLAESLRKVIIWHGTQYDLTSYVPGLVKTSAKGLGKVGEPSDVPLLAALLYSNNPGVASSALASMDALDRERAKTEVKTALGRGWMVDQARNNAEFYLKR